LTNILAFGFIGLSEIGDVLTLRKALDIERIERIGVDAAQQNMSCVEYIFLMSHAALECSSIPFSRSKGAAKWNFKGSSRVGEP